MTIVYRILSAFINIIAIMIAISLVSSLTMLLSSPITMLSAFMMVAIVLYAWFCFQFRRQVLQQQKVVNKSLRDWVRVNGIVTLIFSFLTTLSVLPLIKNPQLLDDALKTLPVSVPPKAVVNLLYGMLFYSIIMFVHILWTFSLMKKHQEYFQ